MKEDENILEKAIEAIKSEQIPPEPPQELVDATVTKLADTQEQSNTLPLGAGMSLLERLRATGGITRFAAAAVVLIAAGYAVGRLSAPQPPDTEELRAALEPAIRKNLIAQLSNELQSGLADLSDELGRQYSRDLSRVGMQILAASNAATNEQFTRLIEAIDEAQSQDRQWVAAAFEQVESNRLNDRTQLSNALATFAMQTEDEFERTKQDLAQLLSYSPAGSSASSRLGNSER